MQSGRCESRDGASARQNFSHAERTQEMRARGDERLGELRHGESGQTTVVMTLFLATFLFGFIAMGIDVEALFHAKRQAQAAADAAAIAAAEEYSNGSQAENTAAYAVAKLNGFDNSLAVNPASVNVTIPSSGIYNGSSSYLQVIVSKPVSTFFSGIVTHKNTVTVSARAVAAAGQSSPTCVCLEGASGTDLNLSNNAKLTPTGCGTTVDSSSNSSPAAISIVGSATLGGLSVGSVATNWDTSSNVNNGGSVASGTKVVQGISTSCAPPVPAAPVYNTAQCTADPMGAYGTFTVGPYSAYGNTQTGGIICYNGLTVGANGAAVNLSPGIYVIRNGTLHFESGANSASNTGGNGVVFYLTGTANLVIDNGANVNLTAPTSGTYAGIVVYQDPGDSTVPRAADTQNISIQGGSNTSFNGAIFAPTSNVTLGNGSGTSINADLVANTLTMNGGGTLNSTATSNFGTLNTSVAKLTE